MGEEDIEGIGIEILQKHFKKTGKLFLENIRKGVEQYTIVVAACYDNRYEYNDDNEKFEFYQLLIDNYKNFFTTDESYNKRCFQASLGIKGMQEWLPRLEELSRNVTTIYYFLAGKIIDKRKNLLSKP